MATEMSFLKGQGSKKEDIRSSHKLCQCGPRLTASKHLSFMWWLYSVPPLIPFHSQNFQNTSKVSMIPDFELRPSCPLFKW